MKRFFKVPIRVSSPWPAIVLAGWIIFFGHSSDSLARENKPPARQEKIQTGKASYYCQRFHGRRTALGTIYNKHHWVAAHPSFPFGTLVRVTNLGNNRRVDVRIIDRGPTKAQRKRGVIIDLSRAAAEKIRMVRTGQARVRLEVLKWGPIKNSLTKEDQDDAVTQSG